MQIKTVKAKKIKDSRGESTIEVIINGQKASSSSGKSTGKYETPSYNKSLDWNIKAINEFKELKEIEITSFNDLFLVERLITRKFRLKSPKHFGANALVALEVAILKALAKEQRKELWQIINPNAKKFPVPVGNAVGGGLHSHNKNHPEFQEFLLIPNKKPPFQLRKNVETMQKAYLELKLKVKAKGKNDEGAWETSLENEQILEILSKFKEIKIGLDIAASSFYKNQEYNLKNETLSRNEQINYINSLIQKYSPLYIEDPLEEEDFNGFSRISKKNLIVGDDLTATQISRLKKAISTKSINAMIIKPNQNGSISELKKIFNVCKKHNVKTILSHRSGETMDNALADLAFGFQADFIKCGISTKWREVKLKRLIEIEKSLKN